MTRPLQGLRMLVVEDEAMVAMLIEDLLIDLGCVVVDVIGALDQGLAFASTSAQTIDAAILDINLGGLPAFPIADALEARGVKFVFASGYDRSAVQTRFAGHVMITKPFRIEALEDALVSALT